MAKSRFIALGPEANGFFDQTTGITIARGQKVEVNENQLRSRRILQALNAGHLIYVQPDQEVEKITEAELTKLDGKLKAMYKKGVTIDKMVKDINLEQAKALAEKHDIQVEDTDTVKDLIEAIIEDYKEK